MVVDFGWLVGKKTRMGLLERLLNQMGGERPYKSVKRGEKKEGRDCARGRGKGE